MIEKPKIQYIGQFYVHGSEAQKLEPKKERRIPRTRLPLERLRKIEKIYLDPVALGAIVVAVVMLITMAVGVLQLRQDWMQYNAALKRVSVLNYQQFMLERDYRASYDLEEVQNKALGLGMVPMDQVPVKTVYVSIPQPEPEPGWWESKMDEIRWFWNGLWE